MRAAFRPAGRRLQRRVVLQVLLAVSAPALLLTRGNVVTAGRLFWITLACVIARLLVVGRRDELLCVLLAVTPFLNLLRGFLFFHIVPALLGSAIVYWFLGSRKAGAAFVRTHRLVGWLAGYFAVYYVLTFASTGLYAVNLRVSECLAGSILVLILGRRREILSAALAGMVASVCLLGAALVPLMEAATDRLGMIEIEGVSLGNPVQFGLPVSLCLLAVIVDRGYWLGLERHRSVRLLLSLPLVTVLLLTTSRASWLVVAVGLACQLAFGRRARTLALVSVLLGFVALRILLVTPVGATVQAGLDRTFSPERSARNRTSGRSDQWAVAYHAVTESAGRLVFGYGAGSGPRVYARKSLETPNVEFEVGNEMALHSFYMQLGVELGLLGLLLFVVWIWIAGRRVIVWSSRTGYLLPLVAFLGYLTIIATVSGNDTVSGAFLGVGLLGAAYVAPASGRPGRRFGFVGPARERSVRSA